MGADVQAAVLGAVVRDGRVLLVRRRHEPDKGKWGLPGGRIELGELMGAAVERELHEETGLSVRADAPLGVFDIVVRAPSGGQVLFHYLVVVLMCRDAEASLQACAGDDADAVGWFGLQDLRELDIGFSDRVAEYVTLALARSVT